MANYSDFTTPGALGLVLTIHGCPYAFGGPGVASVAHTGARDVDWCTATLEWTVLANALDTTGLGWTEDLKFVEADLEVSTLTFRVHDDVAPSGPAAGSNVLTYLAGRAAALVSSPLAASNGVADAPLASTQTSGTFDVADGSLFPASNFAVWIDREVVYCASRSGNRLTIAAGGRGTGAGAGGVYGTQARTHTIDASQSYRPEVYTTINGLSQRTAILWAGKVSGGVLTDPVPLWRGAVSMGPRLSDDGCAWEIEAEHKWNRLGEVPVGAPTAGTRVTGFAFDAGDSIAMTALLLKCTIAGTDYGPSGQPMYGLPTRPGYYPSIGALAASMAAEFPAFLRTGFGVYATVNASPSGAGMRFSADHVSNAAGTAATSVQVGIFVAGQPAVYSAPSAGPAQTVDYPSFPLVLQRVKLAGFTSTLYLNSVAGLPTTWGATSSNDAYHRYARFTTSLVGQAGDYRLTITPTQADVTGGTVVNTAARTVRGQVSFVDNNGQVLPTGGTIDGVLVMAERGAIHEYYLVREVELLASSRLQTNDLWYAFNTVVVNNTSLGGTASELDLDPRDWDFSRDFRLMLATPAQLRDRELVLDGTLNAKDFLVEALQFVGGIPALRRSRIAPDALIPPLRSDVPDAAHTLGVADLDEDAHPRWAQTEQGITNVVDLTLGGGAVATRWMIVDRRSAARYGTRRTLELRARGLSIPADARAQGPQFVLDHALRRIIGLWGDPTETLTLRTDLSRLDSVYLGDVVSTTEWLAPNGLGGRGWTARMGVVVGRHVQLGDDHGSRGYVELVLLAWPVYAQTSGWAPCVRVASIATATLTLANAYIAGVPTGDPTDYAGSNCSDYVALNGARGCVANDAGCGFFAAGHKVQLIQRDTTSVVTASATVASVAPSSTPGASTITLTGAPAASWSTILAGGGIVDLRFDGYATPVTAAQKAWPFVGDRATRTIGGTADPVFVWAP